MSFFVTSPLFTSGQIIPERFTARGEGISPPLAWRGAPDGTRSFALLVRDTDAQGEPVHWAIFDIVSDHLREGAGSRHGEADGILASNDFGEAAYAPPAVPDGEGVHNIFFQLAALRIPSLGMAPGVPARDMWQQVARHTIEEVVLVGLMTGMDSHI